MPRGVAAGEVTTRPEVRRATAWLEIDQEALAGNVAALRSLAGPGVPLLAVVKGNAYGHGAVAVARTVLAAGAAGLVVATVDEVLELRRARLTAPILLLGPIPPAAAEEVIAAGATPALADLELAAALHRAARAPLPVQLKVDTGMGRYGVPVGQAGAFAGQVLALPKLRLDGLFSHLRARSAAELGGMQEQARAFLRVRDELQALGLRPRCHLANTLGLMTLPGSRLDAVRVGGGLYGFDPLGRGAGGPLRPVLSLKSRVAACKDVGEGERIGYGGTFHCRRPTRLLVLPLGYADGLLRELWQGASVLVRGRRAPIVGLINMNQTVVDATDVPGVAVGDEVVLLGAQGRERITAEERVGKDGSVYAVTGLLPERLPRVLVGSRVRNGNFTPGDGRPAKIRP